MTTPEARDTANAPCSADHDAGKHGANVGEDGGCPIVGIGASAGGLAALKQFLGVMPTDSGAAFVVIQHLDPTHESLTAEILARCTTMPVVQVEEPTVIEANRVYVIPPNCYLGLHGQALHLSEPVLYRGLRMPIDSFFRSLAEERRERAVGIIASGTGTDGTLGVKAIKAHGGLVIAQAPESAQYDGMARSAIATGLVDVVRPVDAIPDVLCRYLQHAYLKEPDHPQALIAQTDDLRSVLALLQTHTGHDFRPYKKGTLGRRIARRMGLHHVATLGEYVGFVREQPNEATELLRDLLIGVTAFFREPEAFRILETEVIAPLVEENAVDTPIRIWVPGCASGEEAYSVAMLALERLEATHKHGPVLVFATDIDEAALSVGRTGIYPENVGADIGEERLRRFFTRVDHTYHVNKSLRECVTFAVQSLISDPPFSKLDLISCRNLLIYLEPDVQRNVLTLFHFALNDGGYLFLGNAETVGQQDALFEPVSKKWRLYRRIGPTRPVAVDFPVGRAKTLPAGAEGALPLVSDLGRLRELTEQSLLQDFAPAAVLINRKSQIVYFQGSTVRYLDHPSGAPTNDLLSLVRDGLLTKLRTALQQASAEQRRITVPDARMNRDGTYVRVNLTVKPVQARATPEALLLVTFEDQPEAPVVSAATAGESDSSLVGQLEYELKATREDLQSHIEEQESSNEELQAANEEVMSVNEELQSSNEELETSKEELQSLNEELTTVNNQLKDKVDQLEATTNDLSNLLSSTDIATLFLDIERRIKRFTPASKALFNLVASDVGRPLDDIRQRFEDSNLLGDVERVLEELTPREHEVRTEADRWFIRRVLPYRTADNRIGGVVITFVDVTERKRSEEQSRRLAAVVRDSNDAITVQDFDGRIIAWNRGAERSYGWTEREALAMNMVDLVPEAQRGQALAYVELLARGEQVEAFETQRITKDGHTLDVWLTVTPLLDEAGRPSAIATTERDISERKEADEALREQKAFSDSLIETAQAIILLLDPEGRVLRVNPYLEQLTGYRAEEVVGLDWFTTFLPEGDQSRIRTFFHDVMRDGVNPGYTNPIVAKDGTRHEIEWRAKTVYDAGGNIVGLLNVGHDVTERIESAQALEASKREAERADTAKSRFLAAASHDLRQPLQTISLLNEILNKTVTDPQARKAIDGQRKALGAIEGLIGAYLDISKLEAGIIRPTVTDFPVATLFARLRSVFAPHAQRAGLELRIMPCSASIRSDASLLQQIVENLIANALRHTRPPGRVVVGARRRGERIRLEVWDTGIGIPADQFERIFEDFHQLANPARARQEGLGLGLAIAERMARLLGHAIDVRSTVGKGSVFAVEVPRSELACAAVDAPAPVAAVAPTASEALLLLIDDDPAILDALSLLLQSSGYQTVTAASGTQALEALNGALVPPALIISDHRLPGDETGLDVIRRVRAAVGRDLPAILMTGDTAPEPLREAETLGCCVLHKPAREDALFPLIQQLLQ